MAETFQDLMSVCAGSSRGHRTPAGVVVGMFLSQSVRGGKMGLVDVLADATKHPPSSFLEPFMANLVGIGKRDNAEQWVEAYVWLLKNHKKSAVFLMRNDSSNLFALEVVDSVLMAKATSLVSTEEKDLYEFLVRYWNKKFHNKNQSVIGKFENSLLRILSSTTIESAKRRAL